MRLGDEDARRMEAAGIRAIEQPVVDIAIENKRIAHITFDDGTVLKAETIYSALGIYPRVELAAAMGVQLEDDQRIATDSHQRTSIDGCYAAGDIVTGLNQIGVAMAQGEVAAVDIHNRLRAQEGRCLAG
jgi:thioredoxin reductase (NADPH)